MKRTSLTPALTAAMALFASMGITAQDTKPKYEFGVNLGFLVYQGDLTPQRLGSFETQKFSIGLHASKILNASVSVRANLLLGKLKGDDAVYDNPEYRQQRNFNFTSPVTELSGQLLYNILGRNYAEKGFSPYVFAGVGLALVKVKRDWSNTNVSYFGNESSEFVTGLAADIAHSTPRILPVIPIGVGVKYFFTPKLAVNAESSYRLSRTDYLDGFSQAANAQRKDHYLNYSIGVIYRTGSKNKLACPKMKY
jgi:opacity protein-like surface antigen